MKDSTVHKITGIILILIFITFIVLSSGEKRKLISDAKIQCQEIFKKDIRDPKRLAAFCDGAVESYLDK